jgi:AraC family transcriptional regulator of arabinose operon
MNCKINPMQFHTLVKRTLDHASVNLSGELYRLGYLMEFLALAMESAQQTGTTQKHLPEYNSSVYVEYAVKYFESDYANITVNDVARMIGINRSYLTAIFKKKMGVSPQEYLMRCRMEHARAMLAESNLPVQDIAQRIGYENAMTFSRIFKIYYGLSPRNYRLDLQNTRKNPEDEQSEEKTP